LLGRRGAAAAALTGPSSLACTAMPKCSRYGGRKRPLALTVCERQARERASAVSTRLRETEVERERGAFGEEADTPTGPMMCPWRETRERKRNRASCVLLLLC